MPHSLVPVIKIVIAELVNDEICVDYHGEASDKVENKTSNLRTCSAQTLAS